MRLPYLRVLVTSMKDPASQTIKRVLVNEHGFRPTGSYFEQSPVYGLGAATLLITTCEDMIQCEHLEANFDAEAFIFCSRHRAQSGQPALLVHSTGNFGDDASFGGLPRSLSVSSASLVAVGLRRLKEESETRKLTEFDVTMEVTHHGPTTMRTPLVFVELGSDEAYWTHEEGARAVAGAALACAQVKMGQECAIAFGGTHYASKFTSLVLEGRFRIGHIAPKYALDGISPDVIRQMVSRSSDKVVTALVDWKGTNAPQRERFMPVLEELGIDVVRAR